MPIYEYQCESCQHRLEALQKISDAPLQECPACHEQALKKLVSAASFRLKGGGWYETDFKKDKRKQLADSDSDSGRDGKSESKSDAKADSGTGKSSDGGDAKKAANGKSGAKKSSTGSNKTPSASKSDK